MNNRSFKEFLSERKWIFAVIIVLLVAAAILLVVLRTGGVAEDGNVSGVGGTAASDNNVSGESGTDDSQIGNGDSEKVDSTDAPNGGNTQTGGNGGNNTNGNTGNGNNSGSGNNTGSGNTGSGNNTGNGNNTDSEDNTDNGDITVSQPNVEITERADADYEQWLAATMLVCVSMEYPDFELKGVYSASETSLEDKYSSDGAYIIFTSGGKTIAIHSKAISEERTTSGTKDISSQNVGYATFDVVEPSTVNTGAMTQHSVDELQELIEQSLLISVYVR